MNFLTFIFSLLILISFGTVITLDKQVTGRKIRNTYLGHAEVNRNLLSKCESRTYKAFRSTTKPEKKSPTTDQTKKRKNRKINPDCAKLNLWPLIQEGRETHPFLYQTALSLIKTYYSANLFAEKKGKEAFFLQTFLKKAKEESSQKQALSIEKITLKEDLHPLYYKMLKGTKDWSWEEKTGYPSLLDVIKVEETPSKICLCHAHPGQLAVLFGAKTADKLHQEIHKQERPIVSKEMIETLCSEAHLFSLEPQLFDLIETGNASHKEKEKTTFVAENEESHISIRKNIYKHST